MAVVYAQAMAVKRPLYYFHDAQEIPILLIDIACQIGNRMGGNFNPYLTNGFSHHYHLGESTFIFRGVRSDFYFLSHFSMKFFCANRIAPDGTPRSAASHLELYCLPMSLRKDTRLIRVNILYERQFYYS